MTPDALADLVASDLRRNLEGRASGLSDVYAFCLYADPDGYFLASVGTEATFAKWAQVPAFASRPAASLRAWGGIRWDIGDWHRFPDDEFVSPATEVALQPLVARLLDDSASDEEFDAACLDWERLSFAVLDRAQPLSLLPCTDDAIAFVNFPDLALEQELEVVARTVPAAQMRALFPGSPSLS